MILFRKEPIEEIAASEELDNDIKVDNICDTLEVTKTATPVQNACRNKTVVVELKVKFTQPLGLVTIIDNVANNFVDSIIVDLQSPQGDPDNNGTITVDQNALKVTWANLNVDKPMTATLRFKVLVKDNAIDNNNAYVNNNIHVNADQGRNCTFPHLKGNFYIPPCPESPKVITLVKDNNKNEYDCDETIHSTLILKLDKQDTGVVVTDDLANAFVGVPSNITVSKGSASVDVNNNIVWQVGTVLADTEIKLEYDIPPQQIKTNTGFVTSEVRVDGDLIDPEIVIPRDTQNPNYYFLDTFTRDCPEDGQCCCQACEDIEVEQCEFFKTATVDVDHISCNGKLVDVTVNLQRVCPGRTLNVGVFLVEQTPEGQKSLGFIVKEVTIPESITPCTSHQVPGFCFALTDNNGCRSGNRNFIAKVFANYINTTIPTCDCQTQEL